MGFLRHYQIRQTFPGQPSSSGILVNEIRLDVVLPEPTHNVPPKAKTETRPRSHNRYVGSLT